MDIDARIAPASGHHFGLEIEIPEVMVTYIALIEQMCRWTMRDDTPAVHRKGRCMLADLPTIQRLPIEQRDPAASHRPGGLTHQKAYPQPANQKQSFHIKDF
jgi:hypothetical protein